MRQPSRASLAGRSGAALPASTRHKRRLTEAKCRSTRETTSDRLGSTKAIAPTARSAYRARQTGEQGDHRRGARIGRFCVGHRKGGCAEMTSLEQKPPLWLDKRGSSVLIENFQQTSSFNKHQPRKRKRRTRCGPQTSGTLVRTLERHKHCDLWYVRS